MDVNVDQLTELVNQLSEENVRTFKETFTIAIREMNYLINKMKSQLKSELDRMDTIYREQCLLLPSELLNCPIEDFDGELSIEEAKYDTLGITVKHLFVKCNINEMETKKPATIPRCISEPKLINDKKFVEMITKKPARNATENEPINVLLVSNKGTPLIRNRTATISINI